MRTFTLPRGVEAPGPPTTRDGVRLMVVRPDAIEHTRFTNFAAQLGPGDLLVVNMSATLAAALTATRGDGSAVTVHFATELPSGEWVVEIRPPGSATGPIRDARRGELITLPDGVHLALHAPHPEDQTRLWRAGIGVDGGVVRYLERHGRPIRYAYVTREVPIAEYQTVFARDPGSAEMPSAGRPFTDAIVTELVTRGVGVAPITLHTGVSSQEPGEPPQPEPYRVSEITARQVNLTRAWGGRVIAVGTTVTRALESAADADGIVHQHDGWTDLVIGPRHPVRVVDGLVTGWHAPGASHLRLLAAVAGERLVDDAYSEAVRQRYLWHEFGDSCLFLP